MDWRKKVARVYVAVAQEFKKIAMPVICTRLRHRIDNRARMEPVPGGKTTRLHAEFLQSVGKRNGQIHVRERVIVVPAVQQVIHSIPLASGDGNGGRTPKIL